MATEVAAHAGTASGARSGGQQSPNGLESEPSAPAIGFSADGVFAERDDETVRGSQSRAMSRAPLAGLARCFEEVSAKVAAGERWLTKPVLLPSVQPDMDGLPASMMASRSSRQPSAGS